MRRVDSELAFCEQYEGMHCLQGIKMLSMGDVLLFGNKAANRLGHPKTRPLTSVQHEKALTDRTENAFHQRQSHCTLRATRRQVPEESSPQVQYISRRPIPAEQHIMGEHQKSKHLQGLKNIKFALRLAKLRFS